MKARETEFSNSKVFATNLNIKGMSLAGSMFATRLKVGSREGNKEDSMKNLVVSKLSNTSSVLARNASNAHWHLNK